MREVSLQEYESLELELPATTVAELMRLCGTRLTVVPSLDRRSWTVRAGSHVGSISVDGLRVLIRPKVRAANLFHMLERGGDPLALRPEAFEYERSGDLLPAFATFFASVLERGLARGLPREYREMEERLLSIRGRVDIKRQFNAGGLPVPVACRFDEHTPDTQLNRILLGAVMRLLALPSVAVVTRQALANLASRFDGVPGPGPADLAAEVRFTRLNGHLQVAERLARLVLDGSSITNRFGDVEASSFLVNMNDVFERYLEAQLRRALEGRLEVTGQHTTTLDVEGHIGMRPDLLFRADARPCYVADAKYKLTSDGFGRESDYYQLHAYITALGLPEGVLVYCQHDGNVPPQHAVVRNAGVTLHTRALTLAGSPQDLDDEVQKLADWLSERVGPRVGARKE